MNRSKAPLTLMEQMVMLLVFALAASLCLQAFVHSDAASRRSEARDRAALLCQSMAESIRYTGGDLEAAAERMGISGTCTESLLEVRYDGDWTPSDAPDSAYCLRASLVDCAQNGLGAADVQITETEDGGELFALRVNWQTEVSGGG